MVIRFAFAAALLGLSAEALQPPPARSVPQTSRRAVLAANSLAAAAELVRRTRLKCSFFPTLDEMWIDALL